MNSVAGFLEDILPVEGLADPLAGVLVFVVTFVVLYVLGKTIVVPIVGRILDTRGIDRHARVPLMRITSVAIVIVALIVSFGVAGLQGFLLAFAGVAAAGTLAVGIALQNVIRNVVSGMFIYVDEPFRLGDWIEWNGHVGTVEDIRLRTSQVRTFDNELLTVPNVDLTENVILNRVANEKIRQRFTVGIGFDDDIPEAISYMIDEAERHPEILEEPEPTVRLTDLGDSAVLLQSRFWIADPSRSDFIKIRGEYGANVKRRFDEEEIDIPFPIRTLDGQISIADGMGEMAE